MYKPRTVLHSLSIFVCAPVSTYLSCVLLFGHVVSVFDVRLVVLWCVVVFVLVVLWSVVVFVLVVLWSAVVFVLVVLWSAVVLLLSVDGTSSDTMSLGICLAFSWRSVGMSSMCLAFNPLLK